MDYDLTETLVKLEALVSSNDKIIHLDGGVIRISQTLKMIALRGICCVECGAKGTHFSTEKITHHSPFTTHSLRLMMDNGDIMTRDHIIPSNHGGMNVQMNFQPMCNSCNHAKADKMPEHTVRMLNIVLTKNMILCRRKKSETLQYRQFHNAFMKHRHANGIGGSFLTAEEEQAYFHNIVGVQAGKKDKKYVRVAAAQCQKV